MSKNLQNKISELISNSGTEGILQSDLEKKLKCSKSRVSEIIKNLLLNGSIIRKRVTGRNYALWVLEKFPGYIKGIIRVGMLPSTEYMIHLILIREFAKNVSSRLLTVLYNSSSLLLDDLSLGKIDIGFAPLTSFLLRSGEPKLKIISEVASGGSSICENENAMGNIIMTSEYSSMAVMTARFIRSNPDLESRMMLTPHQAVEDFCSSKFRYLSIWEPYLTLLKKNGFDRVVLSYEESMDDSTCCALGISKLFMDNQAKLNELIDIIRKKGKYVLKYERKIDQEVQFFSNILSIPADIIRESIVSYRFKFGVSTSSLKKVSSLTGISITKEKIEELVY